ncbi:P27 family phage terminase small subunit [Phaeobacter gallaeciensis]|uniref:P27 family phage terminase small subunit n=2 Tax=Rhodobacterales TaxID=204455 RepID=UPI00237F0064|nr:P27 family phage terminase small subunit [Phaeobacter gallaeciensis]MDE4302861.1 P27 family phage terminase small subunit [Phaeobacter gallaeciensis]MDE4307046.1 P27 family phage terminase small subunit [Phaeobacter gallaeciensis]MDE4311511.1 P27 family phage terminase small subunit [Phaeobacter gallaeciensis]MDE4316182.1 P27 family phage terminase small subunit [Phaeobacter gallaeciensis]MDE4320438.1 P27 family phage terminase small subunit [Phaeobacter gallaeciensis]
MKGKKPNLHNVVPMKGDVQKKAPEAPDLLSEGAKAVWVRLAPEMVRKDRLEPIFEDLFGQFCEAANDVIELSSIIAMEGRTYTVKTRNGMQQKKTAAWQARLDALATLKALGGLFGLSPVDDKRLSNPGQGDLFDEMVKQLNGTD